MLQPGTFPLTAINQAENMKATLCQALNLQYPIVQAPMAGVSTPELAAAVSNAGALGSISVGASTPDQARTMIEKTASLTTGPINVNVFCHAPVVRDLPLEKAWIARFHDVFSRYEAEPPEALSEIYQSFHNNAEMMSVLLAAAPAAISFHFGLPAADVLRPVAVDG